jgi:hypothetical protein
MSEKRVKERGKEKYERDSEKIIKEGGDGLKKGVGSAVISIRICHH